MTGNTVKTADPGHRNPTPRGAQRRHLAASWGVHALTASGALAGLMAIDALIEMDFRASLLWLGLAMLIDGIDGPLARRWRIAVHLPRIDGAVLDLVIDYLTYTVIPALLIYRFGLVPTGWELPAAAAIMTTSLYTFANRDMKTPDNYFCGFPAVWNLVVLYIYLLPSLPALNLALIGLLCLLTFAPLKFIHPFRVREGRPLTILATALWAVSSAWLVIESGGHPPAAQNPVIFWVWIMTSAYFAGFSLWRSVRPG